MHNDNGALCHTYYGTQLMRLGLLVKAGEIVNDYYIYVWELKSSKKYFDKFPL